MMPVIDFHTHVLPEIDDGSKSVEESLEMLRIEARQGIEHVVATPHFYANHDLPERFLEKRQKAKKKLEDALETEQGLPKVSVGAEVYFFEGISDCEYLRDMAIEGTDCVMIEMPMKQWSDRSLRELYEIKQKQKLTPIIAHLDRYITPFTAKKTLVSLSELPVIIQVNSRFFTRRTTRGMALRFLREGRIHLIGSDCHDTNARLPDVDKALEVISERGISYINYTERKIFRE
ncbi:MAG: hypothetical protein IJ408_04720 [Clostridia bacterium]|nr:hypothetical protein [Clostridia bacterium]